MTVESKIIEEKARLIAKRNDTAREQLACKVVLSLGVADLLEHNKEAALELLNQVRNFTDFNEGDDPYKEHDFGAIDFQGTKYFWKIDYYNQSMNNWCDPLDELCVRVLTIMEAREY